MAPIRMMARAKKIIDESLKGVSVEKEAIEEVLASIDVWLLVFGVIVVIGVAGESFFGIRHWWNSRKLQAIQAAENEAQRTEIARLRAAVSQADARFAEANKQAEQERLARVKIEERLAPRMLKEEQWQKILKKIESFAGTEFEVRAFTNRDTARVLGIMVELFHRARWIQYPVENPIIIPTKYGNAGVVIASGIQVVVDPRYPEPKKPAVALVDALMDEGIDAEVKEAEQEKNPERIRIDIGEKPA